ncbi:SPW repeat protein [Haloarcula laminariae]|uniref:SPW repeat protein n=1 Tax=Haloarcula laminariae TaxID=2961577 RepID=UPI0021C9C861|nr:MULTISPECIES: SPW repeat protein [Halomicroarcula]
MSNNTTDERTHDRVENPDESGKGISAVIALLGLWMILQAVLFDIVVSQFWNDIGVGALLLAVGAYNYYRRSNKELGSIGAASVAALLGLWLVIAPFVLGAQAGLTETTNDLAFWNDIVVGLLAFGLGSYSAYEARADRQEAAERRTVS